MTLDVRKVGPAVDLTFDGQYFGTNQQYAELNFCNASPNFQLKALELTLVSSMHKTLKK